MARGKLHPALKHAGYSATAVLPGEDPAQFEKLHRGLIEELRPNGTLEEEIVATIARLVWRGQHLATYRKAELARARLKAIRTEHPLPAVAVELKQAVEDQARDELGAAFDLIALGEAATFAGLLTDLEVYERLQGMIDRCVKRLLFVRGVKSLPIAVPRAPYLPPPAKPK